MPPVLAVTPGEPAGVGPEIAVSLLGQVWPGEVVLIGDPELLRARARAVGAPPPERVIPVPLAAASVPGRLDVRNAPYVLETLRRAAQGCLDHEFDALVTGPVHKGVINDAGFSFTGHTEFLAGIAGTPVPVMLLVAGALRVALATTHLPLREVATQITQARVAHVLQVLHHDLQDRFGFASPRINVLGLNPHAGEGGHLGREEIDVLAPVVRDARERGWRIFGPSPADTAFTPGALAQADAILAMYHDQGLPPLKQQSFGEAVNVTLGLPFIRTSVDHGTALSLAGTGRAEPGSFHAAARLAFSLIAHASGSS